MLVSVKPFSSPLYEDATLLAFCKISTLLLKNLSRSAFTLCTKEGVEEDAYSVCV